MYTRGSIVMFFLEIEAEKSSVCYVIIDKERENELLQNYECQQ